MTWWLWTLLVIVLAAGAVGVLFALLRSLWRKGMALARELGEASERLSAVAEELAGRAAEDRPAEELAVFRSPGQLRAERVGRRRAGSAGRGRGDRSQPRG